MGAHLNCNQLDQQKAHRRGTHGRTGTSYSFVANVLTRTWCSRRVARLRVMWKECAKTKQRHDAETLSGRLQPAKSSCFFQGICVTGWIGAWKQKRLYDCRRDNACFVEGKVQRSTGVG